MLLSTTDTSRTLDSKHPEIPLCCLFAPAGSVTVSDKFINSTFRHSNSSLQPHLSFCLALFGSVCMLNCSMFRRSLSLRRFLCRNDRKEKRKHFSLDGMPCCQSSPLILPQGTRYLCKPHPVPLVCCFLGPGRVHQLEAGLILLVEIGVLAATSKL